MSSSIIDCLPRARNEYAGRTTSLMFFKEEDLNPFSISRPEVTEQGLSRSRREARGSDDP